jgi:hypothetical protein
MADFLCVRIIGVLLSNTKHLLTLQCDRCRWLLRHCIESATRAKKSVHIARVVNLLLRTRVDTVVGSDH